MNRREFLASAVSSVATALAGCQTDEGVDSTPDDEHGVTAEPDCEKCRKLAEYQEMVRENNIPWDKSRKAEIESLFDPAYHSWEGRCQYKVIVDGSEYTEEGLLGEDYDIEATFDRGIVDVAIDFKPSRPLEVVEANLEVGDV